MEHYETQHTIEISGNAYLGSNWGRKRKTAIFELWVEPLMHRSKRGSTPEDSHTITRVEQLDFHCIGSWWYAKFKVSYPPALVGEEEERHLEFIQKNLISFYNSPQNYTSPQMAKKNILNIVQELQAMLTRYAKAKVAKEAATSEHEKTKKDLESFSRIHRKEINPDGDGVRYTHGEDETETYLLSFHKHHEPRFTADFDLARAFRRFPQLFKVNPNTGSISISVDDVKALQADKVTSKQLAKFGIFLEEKEVFYAER